jgi:outer membrane usher protein FimD/PapC
MNNPNRKIYTGDRFGYDYDIKSFSTNLWLQNMINLPQWDLSYSAEVSYTEFKRRR